MTKLSWLTLLGLVACTPCRVRYEYLCLMCFPSVEARWEVERLLSFLEASMEAQLLYLFLLLRLWEFLSTLFFPRAALEVFLLMPVTDLL